MMMIRLYETSLLVGPYFGSMASLEQESGLMPKPKYDHPVIQKGAVQVFAHLVQKPMSPELKEVNMIYKCCTLYGTRVVRQEA